MTLIFAIVYTIIDMLNQLLKLHQPKLKHDLSNVLTTIQLSSSVAGINTESGSLRLVNRLLAGEVPVFDSACPSPVTKDSSHHLRVPLSASLCKLVQTRCFRKWSYYF